MQLFLCQTILPATAFSGMGDGSLDDISVIAKNNTKDKVLSNKNIRSFKRGSFQFYQNNIYGSVYQSDKTIHSLDFPGALSAIHSLLLCYNIFNRIEFN